MQIKQKLNKKALESKSATVALRKITTEKAKQAISSLESELEVLRNKSASNEKKLELRKNYSARLDEMIATKEEDVKTQKRVLMEKQSSSSQESQQCDRQKSGPDVMQYIMHKAEMYELKEAIKTMERKIEIAEGNKTFKRRQSRCSSKDDVDNMPSFHWTPGML